MREASASIAASSPAPITVTPDRAAKPCARSIASAAVRGRPGANSAGLPRSGTSPASSQPIVPLRSATTLFGTPAWRRLSAPRIDRVRPAQFTTISVSALGTISAIRYASSPPGMEAPVGIDMRRYSSIVRLSSTTMSRFSAIQAFSSGASTLSVPKWCSTHSPNALLGTFTPLNST